MLERTYRRALGLTVLLPAFALHLAGFLLLVSRHDLGLLEGTRYQDSLFLIGVSAAIVAGSWLLGGRPYAWSVLLLQAVVIGLAGVPIPEALALAVLLVSALALQVVFLYGFPKNVSLLVAASVVVFLVTFLGRSGQVGFRMTPHDAGMVVLGVTGSVVAIVARTVMERLQDTRAELSVLRRATSSIARTNVQYQDYAAHVAEISSVEERKRITRELHDAVGLAFTNVIAMMNAVIKRPLQSTDELTELLDWVRETCQTGLKNTRSILYQLRDVAEPRLSLVELILRVTRTFERSTGIQVTVEWGNLPLFVPSSRSSAVSHLVQEALVNSFRHGNASRVEVHFRVAEQVLLVTVSDNGSGGAIDKHGIGQSGVTERVQSVGGWVRYHTSSLGYTVEAAVPLTVQET